ncbi:MAG: hypothetical protein JWM57_4068 [Phycisphaerales bacterium]|nr:hypothetical protein [Phycisphaerales bacterium]
MDKPHLEITYRDGRPAKAYLTLPRRRGDRAERTIPHDTLLVDYSIDGRPIGIEIESVSDATIPLLRALLRELGVKGVDANDLSALST